jgi:iron complex outermembrane recepter protein
MMMEKVISRSIRVMFAGGLVLSAGMLAQPAFADESTQRVEITGSSIKRVATEASLPVQTFDQKDIVRSGVTTVTDFIQQLPVMQGFSVAADSVGGGGGGVTTASIHDVGEQYTLVLLNGRRIAPSNSGSTIDLNSIPLAAIERIEVLTDGASALYGSDAIAGVVNFILKKGEAPLTIDAKYTSPQHPGGKGYNVGISKGFGNLEENGYNVFLSYSHDEQKQLKASQRDFAKTGIIKFNGSGVAHTDPGEDDDTTYAVTNQQLEFFNGSSRSVPPNVTVGYTSPTTGKRTSTSFMPYFKANGACPPAHEQIGNQCYFDYTSTIEIFPEQKRDGFFGSGSVKLGTSGFKAFGDFAYTDADIIARIAPYPAEFALSTTSPLYAQYVSPYLTATQRANVTDVTVKYRLYDLGNRTYDYNTQATHIVGGIDGSLMGWDINSAVTFSENKQNQKYLAGFPLADKFTAALASGEIDPFPYKVGEMPAAMIDKLKSTQFTGTYDVTDIKMRGIDFRGQHDMFQLGGGTAILAAGADYRKTSYDVKRSDVAKTAAILFDDEQVDQSYSRTNGGLFAEMNMPFSKQLEATASVRYDSVSGVDDGILGKTVGNTQSATTYKVNGSYQPLPNLKLRAGYGTGFRVARMTQIAQPLEDFGVTGGTYDCPVGVPGECDGRGQMEVFQGGNKDLKPEHSKQWSVGAVFEPLDNLSIKLDLWNVSIKDAVSSVSEGLIMGDPVKYRSLFTTKHKNSTGRDVVAIILAPINIGKSENRGLDYDFMLRNKIGDGKLTTRLAGTYLITDKYTTPGTDDSWETSLGEFGSNDAVSFRNVIKLSGTYEIGAWTHSLTGNYRSGYKDKHQDAVNCAVTVGNALGDCVDIQLNVPAYYTFDWQTQWRMMKNLTFTGGIINLADKNPPLSIRNTGSHQLGYDPRYASPLGRTFYVSGQYKF